MLVQVLKLLNQNNRLGIIFAGNLLKQDKIAYYHNAVVNIYIVYKLLKRTAISPDFTVQNALFGAVKVTKDVNTSHYSYSGYGICFDAKSSFSFGNSLNAKNVIIFGCDMSFSSHANYRANNIYVFGKDFIQGINGTTIYAEKMYETDFTEQGKKFVLSLHYSGDDSYLFVNGVQQLKFKTKNSEIKGVHLSLRSLATDFSTINMTKSGLFGNVYDFAADYAPISCEKAIYDIHRYLIKKLILYKSVWFNKLSVNIGIYISCKFFKVHFIKKSRM